MRAGTRTSAPHLAGVAGVAGILCILHSSAARAEPSAWLSAGGGLKRVASGDLAERAAAMSFALGVGTSPLAPVVVGGLVRTTTSFGLGTDLGLSARVATGGFARGQWGVALDAGPSWRSWGSGTYGLFPVGGMLVIGAPWGLQLGVGGEAWDLAGEPFAQGVLALLEVDLLRLTVMRQGATDRWWENPSPAGGRVARSPANR